jgi:hypothetical protein
MSRFRWWARALPVSPPPGEMDGALTSGERAAAEVLVNEHAARDEPLA